MCLSWWTPRDGLDDRTTKTCYGTASAAATEATEEKEYDGCDGADPQCRLDNALLSLADGTLPSMTTTMMTTTTVVTVVMMRTPKNTMTTTAVVAAGGRRQPPAGGRGGRNGNKMKMEQCGMIDRFFYRNFVSWVTFYMYPTAFPDY